MTENLVSIRCPTCAHRAKEVIYAAKNTRRGWYCSNCGHFEPAVGREKLVSWWSE